MLSPRAPRSSAFVCLRCSLNLARPATFVSRRSLHATFSTSTSRHDDPDNHDSAADSEATSSYRRLSRRPLRIVRRQKSGHVQKTAVLEGVKALGEDADILVLERLRHRRRVEIKDEPDIQPRPEDQKTSNILAQLEAEATQVGEEEINKQIDSLRPETRSTADEPHFITQVAYKRIARALTKGFTVRQLSRYFSVAHGIQQSQLKEKLKEDLQAELQAKMGKGKRPVDRTQWYPGTTSLAKRRAEASLLKGPKSKPPGKPVLVDQILRNVWNLVLLEEIEGDGELELALKPWQISLLNAGETPTSLDKIGRMRKAKIEIIVNSVLRITADKGSAEYAADDIEQLLKETEVQTFKVDPWVNYIQDGRVPKDKPTEMFTPSTLLEVGKLTGTIIQIVSNNQIMIRGLDKDSLQDAHQCLIRSLPLKSTGTHSIETRILDASREECNLIPNVFNNSLAYPSRHLALGRWTAPASKPSTSESSPDEPATHANCATTPKPSTAELEVLKNNILDAIMSQPLYEPPESSKTVPLSSNARWHVQPNRRMSVSFGHMLFPTGDCDGKAPTFPRSVFSTDIPGLANVMAFQNFREAPDLGSLDYRFIPSPLQRNSLNNTDYPELRMRFQTHGDIKLKTVSLKFNEHHHDVLLPNQAADLRFTNSYNLALYRPLLDPKIKEFSDFVVANIKSGGRLTAPPEIAIEIPRWVFPSYTRNNPNTRNITYLFTGIAYQQTLVSPYQGHLSTLNIVQQGKLGSKGGVLSLRYMVPKKETPEASMKPFRSSNDAERFGGFVDLALEVVGSITKASASQVPLSKIWRPRNQSSTRKQRRSATNPETVVSQDVNVQMPTIETTTENSPTDVVTESSTDTAEFVSMTTAADQINFPKIETAEHEDGPISETPPTFQTASGGSLDIEELSTEHQAQDQEWDHESLPVVSMLRDEMSESTSEEEPLLKISEDRASAGTASNGERKETLTSSA